MLDEKREKVFFTSGAAQSAHGCNLISFRATKCELTYFLARSFIKLIFPSAVISSSALPASVGRFFFILSLTSRRQVRLLPKASPTFPFKAGKRRTREAWMRFFTVMN